MEDDTQPSQSLHFFILFQSSEIILLGLLDAKRESLFFITKFIYL